MKLSELFVKDAMIMNLTTTSKDETLQALANSFHQTGGVSDTEAYVKALQAREAQSTTGVGDEIAIPHAQHESIEKAAIIFGKSEAGIDWASFDGQDAKLIFMIAAPTGGGNEHLQALAGLSSILMKPEAKAALLKATTPEEVVAIFASYEEEKEETKATVEETADTKDDVYILAVTACPTGIAHTFMAEEKLKQAAAKAGYKIKVETNGQGGINNKLTKKDIEEATAIIVAADKQVEMARFDGRPTIITKVADGINKADELVERAAKADAHIYHHQGASESVEESDEANESLGRQFYKHLMNGVSHMLPFVVAGGILIAVSFIWGINSANPDHASYNPIAQTINLMGGLSFAMMLPILAGFIGQSIADRPGLVIGFMGGVFANPGVMAAYAGGTGVFKDAVSSGFLGALVAGFLAGAIVKFLQKAFSWLPKSLEGLKPIFIYPVLGVAIMGALMLFVVNGPMGAVMNGLTGAISAIPQEYTFLLGFVVGGMMSIDMGGPINKAAYVTGTALVTAANGAGSNVMAAVMVGGMVPPLAIALAATFNKNLWDEQQRSSAFVNYVMGAAFITEGAIPFAASNPVRVIPSLALGAGVAGALSMMFNCVSKVPHGGLFAVAVGGVTNPLQYIIAWLVGGVVGALMLNVLLPKKNK
ncbi:PTS fructose transporter subunit IIC [Atopobacter sp. AH10]|uniref:PTS fructose transporter subunit IIABC n=1 Tax=Atopobacter sp. AH10 TaxID=2315861 RepID=UPI000EF26206|nr:fructose-specific PTS transporter subunit EIIC [Atopobacter sp. AH10]RLK62885.1 PTS fructose transporter subunit IIC [Atopobacter sp. AH10]